MEREERRPGAAPVRHGERCYALIQGERHLERCEGSGVEAIFDQVYCGYHAEGIRRATGGRFVYFAKRGELIKIGVATDPEARMRELSAKLIATLPGGRDLERELHARFIDYCVHGEWFLDVPPLRDFIANTRTPEAVTSEAVSPAERAEA